jgi:hypothetical protein
MKWKKVLNVSLMMMRHGFSQKNNIVLLNILKGKIRLYLIERK